MEKTAVIKGRRWSWRLFGGYYKIKELPYQRAGSAGFRGVAAAGGCWWCSSLSIFIAWYLLNWIEDSFAVPGLACGGASCVLPWESGIRNGIWSDMLKSKTTGGITGPIYFYLIVSYCLSYCVLSYCILLSTLVSHSYPLVVCPLVSDPILS